MLKRPLIALVLLAAACQPQQTPAPETKPADPAPEQAAAPAQLAADEIPAPAGEITVASVTAGAKVKSPLTVEGTVINNWMFEGVFPAGAAVAWKRMADAEVELYPEERALVAKAVKKRQREFGVGRACARRALAELGLAPQAILSGETREPLWPAGIVGSISHDRALGVAVVGRTERFLGFGVDVSPDDS